jgi:hypothetical protein
MSRATCWLCSLARRTRHAILCDRYPSSLSCHPSSCSLFPPFSVSSSSCGFPPSPSPHHLTLPPPPPPPPHPRRLAPPPTLALHLVFHPLPHLALPSRRFPCFSALLSLSPSSFRPTFPHTSIFLLLLVVSLPLSSLPHFVFPSLHRPHSSNSLPLHQASFSSSSTFSSSTLLLPANSPPGFKSSPLLGTCCRWVHLPARCYRCHSHYRLHCRCRHHRPFAGIASSGCQVIVAAMMWVVDAVWGLSTSPYHSL